jgi:hypothetical protein
MSTLKRAGHALAFIFLAVRLLTGHTAAVLLTTSVRLVSHTQVVENARPDVRVTQLPAAGQDQQLPPLLEHLGAGE